MTSTDITDANRMSSISFFNRTPPRVRDLTTIPWTWNVRPKVTPMMASTQNEQSLLPKVPHPHPCLILDHCCLTELNVAKRGQTTRQRSQWAVVSRRMLKHQQVQASMTCQHCANPQRARHPPPRDTVTCCKRQELQSKPLHSAYSEIVVLALSTASRKTFTNGHLEVDTTTASVTTEMLFHLSLSPLVHLFAHHPSLSLFLVLILELQNLYWCPTFISVSNHPSWLALWYMCRCLAHLSPFLNSKHMYKIATYLSWVNLLSVFYMRLALYCTNIHYEPWNSFDLRFGESPSLVLVINDTMLLMSCVKCLELGISNTCDEGVCGKEWWPQDHKEMVHIHEITIMVEMHIKWWTWWSSGEGSKSARQMYNNRVFLLPV
jgi:hypothetical protein